MPRIIASFLIVLLVPVLLFIALLVLLSMGRPVLFVQQRSGKGGVPFAMVKFRTMNDRRDTSGDLLPDEYRTSAFGALLRRSRLDELPGLWNVARGEMAFIGPRPLLPQTIAKLGKLGVARGQIRPGLTGWAQVNGNALLSLREKVDLDLWYIEHRNWRLKLGILVRTAWVMIAGERPQDAAKGRTLH